tara:strand:+ start:1929 stop:2795 length:867 start_codon:yes stop_codon:yes gene_type:complete
MKFKLKYILILIIVFSCKQNNLDVKAEFKTKQISELVDTSVTDSINENWAKKDLPFLLELEQILKNDESDVLGILKIDENDVRIKLGFGYEQIEGTMGKGYAGIYYNLILKEEKVISYEITPNFPRNKLLTERYLKLFSRIFKIDDNTIYNRYYNIENMEKPLKNINSNVSLNENLRFLMTPFAGTRYGFSGGFGGGIFTNRTIFLEESKNITPEVCHILMNSINPATRLMAIEFYMKNKSNFENQGLINNWIETVYSELPTIGTMEGCFGIDRNSRNLVEEYVQIKN